MKSLNYIIVDDEKPARALIENYCNKIEGLKFKGSFKSALDALSILNSKEIDLVFLDIQMPEISGIDFLKTLQSKSFKVIFTTAYRDYALEGFELDASDYLLKPIEFPRFLRAVNKVKEAIQPQQNITIKEENPTTTLLKSSKRLYRVNYKDIEYIKSEHEYLNYVLESDQHILVHGSLKDLVLTLPKHSFIRVHRSFIVNLNHISYVDGNSICIKETFIPIGETYREVFFKAWT